MIYHLKRFGALPLLFFVPLAYVARLAALPADRVRSPGPRFRARSLPHACLRPVCGLPTAPPLYLPVQTGQRQSSRTSPPLVPLHQHLNRRPSHHRPATRERRQT